MTALCVLCKSGGAHCNRMVHASVFCAILHAAHPSADHAALEASLVPAQETNCPLCRAILSQARDFGWLGKGDADVATWQRLDHAAGRRNATTCVCEHGPCDHNGSRCDRCIGTGANWRHAFQRCTCEPCWGKAAAACGRADAGS